MLASFTKFGTFNQDCKMVSNLKILLLKILVKKYKLKNNTETSNISLIILLI